MAQSPQPQPPRTKWLWVAVIVVFTVLLTIVLFNPSGQADGTMEDPVVMEDTGEGTGVGQTPPASGPAPEPCAPGGEPSD